MVEGYMDEHADDSAWLQLAMVVSEGMEDLQYTMRHVTHNEIANVYIRQQLKEAKAAPDLDE